MRSEKEILSTFMRWAQENNNLRTAIMTSSRTHENASIDFLSDYDIELYVSDLSPFTDNDDWLSYFGNIMVRWPLKPRSTGFDHGWITRLVLFQDGLRLDFQITDNTTLSHSHYTNGYKVLIDKDSMANTLEPPTYNQYIIKKPTEEEYVTLVSEFWWDAYYVPKYLWRDELPFAKYMLDSSLRYSFLHKIINWYIGYQHDWTVETGALGKKFKKLLPPELWQEFEDSYEGGGIEANWDAFYRVITLFRKVAKYLGTELGYPYPEDIDTNVMNFIANIRKTK